MTNKSLKSNNALLKSFICGQSETMISKTSTGWQSYKLWLAW